MNPVNNPPVWITKHTLRRIDEIVGESFILQTFVRFQDDTAEFMATRTDSGEKVTVLAAQPGKLAYQHLVLSQFHHIENDWGLPRKLLFEQASAVHVLVTSHCGESLETYPRNLEANSRGTGSGCILWCLKVFLQLVYRLETLHSFKVVHGDVRPSNIRFREQTGTLFLTGFCTARFLGRPCFENPQVDWEKDHAQRPMPAVGSCATLGDVHENNTGLLHRRDDLESALLVFMDLCSQAIQQPEKLAQAFPLEVVHICTYITALPVCGRPDYNHLRLLVLKAMMQVEESAE